MHDARNSAKVFSRLLRGTTIAAIPRVEKTATNILGIRTRSGVDMVDLMEDMLFQRAASGIRPMLYVSSDTDLECSMLMLLDDMDEVHWSGTQQHAAKQVGYHMVTN